MQAMTLPQPILLEDLFERLTSCLTAAFAPDDSDSELEAQAAELEALVGRARAVLGDEGLWVRLASEALGATEVERGEILQEIAQTRRLMPAFERSVQRIESRTMDPRIPAPKRARLQRIASVFREAQGLSRAILELVLAVHRAFEGLPQGSIRRGHWLRYQAAKAKAFAQDPSAATSDLWADLDAIEASRTAEDILAAARALRSEQALLAAHTARGGSADSYDPSQA